MHRRIARMDSGSPAADGVGSSSSSRSPAANDPQASEGDYADRVWSKGYHVYFYSGVSKDAVYRLYRELLDLQSEFDDLQRSYPDVVMAPPPIYLHINSFGGSVFAAFAAVDFIKQSPLPVYTVVEGAVASAATLMAIAGKRRFMRPHASMLIHELSSWFEGKMTRMEDEIDNLRQMMADIKDIYREHTRLEDKELEETLKHDIWWKAEKCVQKGLVDEVWKSDNPEPALAGQSSSESRL